MSCASRGLAPREGLECLLVKMGRTRPLQQPRRGPQAGKSGDPRSQNADGLHEEGECRQLEFWAGKGANIRDLFCTTPKVLKLHENQFWNVLKILGEESTRGGPHPVHEGGGRALLLRGPPGSPSMPIFWYKVSFSLEKSEGSFRDEVPSSRGGTLAEPI